MENITKEEDGEPITMDEIIDMFGGEMSMEACKIIFEARDNPTTRNQLREKLRAFIEPNKKILTLALIEKARQEVFRESVKSDYPRELDNITAVIDAFEKLIEEK